MNEHADNPPSNRLPSGVEEAGLLEAVRMSGYPLQSLVARQLASEFHVVEEWGYTDRTTKEHRTLDIYAFCDLADGPSPPRLHLLVECKRSDLPYVFFPPGVERLPHDFPEVVGIGQFGLSVGRGTTRDASPAEFFCAGEFPFVTNARLAVTFARAQPKAKQFELSGEVPFNQVVLPLVSAVEQMRQIFQGAGATALIVLSVCVVDAPMVVASGTPETPSLALEPWVRVVHEETIQQIHHWGRRHYVIDFVHRQFLGRYIAEHVFPFATSFAARMTQFKRGGQPGQALRPQSLTWDAFVGGRP